MTKNESKILIYLKSHPHTLQHEILNKCKDDSSYLSKFVLPEERIEYLTDLGLISSDGEILNITSLGLHELDEYLENQTRLDCAEKLAILANIIAVGTMFATLITK